MEKIKGFKIREFKEKNYRAVFNERTGQTLRIALDTKQPIGSLQYPELLDVSFGTKCLANCFVPSTEIHTINGIKLIPEIKVDDEVFSYDDSVDDFVKEIVYETFEEDYDGDIIGIELENGIIIRSTPNHEFLTQRGWINAENITEEDDIKAMRNMQR